jgi:hypothetical protein
MGVHNPPVPLEFSAVDEIREEGTGLINNVNKVFTSSVPFEASTLKVFLSGQLLDIGASEDYTITGADEITLADAPQDSPGNPDKVTLIYIPT